jgi:hypothetical protein
MQHVTISLYLLIGLGVGDQCSTMEKKREMAINAVHQEQKWEWSHRYIPVTGRGGP